MSGEKRFRIRYARRSDMVVLLSLAILAVVLLSYLAWGLEEVAASGRQKPVAASTGIRKFYLNRSPFNGANAINACADGYHFASLWEILDPSNLKYNTDLGQTTGDSGQGPPDKSGWVRTGSGVIFYSSAGNANCDGWNTSDASARGTSVKLTKSWTTLYLSETWVAYQTPCDQTRPVWCVEGDEITHLISVNLVGSGNGSVTSQPIGIACGTDCSETFSHGQEVTLYATADTGSTFTGWSGDCSGTKNCSITSDANKTITATFEADIKVPLPIIFR